MASVLFLDIVGFTSMCSRLDPARMTQLLGQLMGRLDDLARLHDVQRVDVVGDAYIAATNLLKDQHADHAARLARFAVDAVAAASSVVDDWCRGEGEFGDGEAVQIQVRVGMHSGAVAGLVVRGNARKHTLVGEAARGAARLEQTGLAGRVQCSEASARLIAAQARDLELHPRRREEDGDGEVSCEEVKAVGRGGLVGLAVGAALSTESLCFHSSRARAGCRLSTVDAFVR